jgi:hypothetical protein
MATLRGVATTRSPLLMRAAAGRSEPGMSATPVRLRRGRPQDTFSIQQVRYIIGVTTMGASPKVDVRLRKTQKGWRGG